MTHTLKTVLENYFSSSTLLKDGKFNLEGFSSSFSIDLTLADEKLQSFSRGGALRQHVFFLTSCTSFQEPEITQIRNSSFFKELCAWMSRQTKLRILPKLENSCTTQQIEPISADFIFNAEQTEAKYQIKCRLVYYQKGE